MVNTSPRDVPTTQNTSRELRASVENPQEKQTIQNCQDSDSKMATPGHVNPPPHAPETTNLPTTTAESPPKHLPSELPASAENLAMSGTASQAVPDGNNMVGLSKPSPTKLPPATSPAATSDTILPSMSKRKKKRSNKSLSRHGRGRKAKAINHASSFGCSTPL